MEGETEEVVLKEDNVVIEPYVVNLTPYVNVGKFAADLVFEMLMSARKMMSKSEMDSRYDVYAKEFNVGQLKITNIEIQKILNSFELLDINEEMSNVLWIGPDCLNVSGINNEILEENE